MINWVSGAYISVLEPCYIAANSELRRWAFTYCNNALRARQNGRHFSDDIFKWIFLKENVWISINISLKFVPRGPINNIPTLVQIMAWRRPGDKPLSEPMMIRLQTYICVARPQWVKIAMAHVYTLQSFECLGRKVLFSTLLMPWENLENGQRSNKNWFTQ